MSTTVRYGTTDWNDDTSKRSDRGDKKTQFKKLKPGSNIVRVVTDPKKYQTHKYQDKDASGQKEPGYGDWCKCSKPLHGTCPLCDLGDYPKMRWYVGVIDRETNATGVLDISSLIYDQVKALNKTKWGDPKRYDLEIVMDPKAKSAAQWYKVFPQMPEPLTPAEVEMAKGISDEFLNKLCTPPTPDEVKTRINGYREKRGLPPIRTPGSGPSGVASPVGKVSVSASDDDGEIDFSAHEG